MILLDKYNVPDPQHNYIFIIYHETNEAGANETLTALQFKTVPDNDKNEEQSVMADLNK